MDTIVLKFGGSSVADNEKLKIVAEKIIGLYNKKNNIVVVVSAQGKTTDKLIKEAKELSEFPENREMDMLLSTGEQITIAKLSILLNEMGYNAISLTGWQKLLLLLVFKGIMIIWILQLLVEVAQIRLQLQ